MNDRIRIYIAVISIRAPFFKRVSKLITALNKRYVKQKTAYERVSRVNSSRAGSPSLETISETDKM